jgi:hypothetical protein
MVKKKLTSLLFSVCYSVNGFSHLTVISWISLHVATFFFLVLNKHVPIKLLKKTEWGAAGASTRWEVEITNDLRLIKNCLPGIHQRGGTITQQSLGLSPQNRVHPVMIMLNFTNLTLRDKASKSS